MQPNEISPGALCNAQLGHVGGYQYINVPVRSAGNDCFDFPGRVSHEILHALSYVHMHQTAERDSSIRILWENIASGAEANFNIWTQSSLLGTQYDFE